MADISKDALRKEITAILKDADLATTSAKKVRQQIEEKLECDLTERRKEIDELVMECLEKKQDVKKEGGKKRSKSDDEEESEEQAEESEEESEQEERKEKRSAAKKPPPKRAKKASSDDESDEASDDNASDEDFNPGGKKGKAGGKKGKAKPKKKGSDSDDGSDEDWNKSRRAAAATAKKAAGGATTAKRGGGGGGYTRAYNLSPELAAVMGTEKMARHEVVRKMWSIIKEKNLYDPKNKQFAICNDELLAVFGVKRFRTFGMMKYLKNHFLD